MWRDIQLKIPILRDTNLRSECAPPDITTTSLPSANDSAKRESRKIKQISRAVVSAHALRSATIGSTPAARRAGTTVATSAATASNTVAAASMAGSHGCTPNN